MELVDKEKARVASLEQEMAAIQEQLARAGRESAEREQNNLVLERKRAEEELAEMRQALDKSKELDQKAKDETLARLEAEMSEKEAIRQERANALQRVAEAEKERQEILVERERAIR